MEVAEFLLATVDQIDTAYQRAVEAVRRIGDRGFADSSLNTRSYQQLVSRGHFKDYVHELDWAAQEVAGHLADSATVFGARIKVIRDLDMPSFGDFVTDEPQRVQRYRSTSFTEALDRLVWTHQYLRSQVESIESSDLDRIGVHEFDGEVSVRSILDFLPGHIADHVAQLRALASTHQV
ncbi:MAG: DinB family protein [Acidimicrobiales bacterium]|nr:DinB family protein [Acidimicrobiales bacterium]